MVTHSPTFEPGFSHQHSVRTGVLNLLQAEPPPKAGSLQLEVKLLQWRKRFIQPVVTAISSSLLSVTVVYICLAIALIILRDTLLWHAHLLITHPHTFLRLLTSLLPPSTRQPGPVAVLLGQTLKLSLIFYQSFTLFWSTEKCLAAAFPLHILR